MKHVRLIAAILLAIPFIVFPLNGWFEWFDMTPPEEPVGMDMLVDMKEAGLMNWIAIGHLVCGVGLLIPRFRFASGLLHLPLSIGMVGFHATVMPEGMGFAAVLLVLNLIVIAEPGRLFRLVAPAPS